MSNESRLPELRPVSQQSQPQTSSSQSSTFALEQLAQVLSSHKEETLKQVSETVSSQIKDFEENLRTSNANLAQTVIQESAEPFVSRRRPINSLMAVKNRKYERVQQELEEGRDLISKRQKVFKLADKSGCGLGCC